MYWGFYWGIVGLLTLKIWQLTILKCFTNLTTWSNNFLYLIILLLYFQVSNSILLDYIAGDPTNYPLTKYAFGFKWKTYCQNKGRCCINFPKWMVEFETCFNLNQNQNQYIRYKLPMLESHEIFEFWWIGRQPI